MKNKREREKPRPIEPTKAGHERDLNEAGVKISPDINLNSSTKNATFN